MIIDTHFNRFFFFFFRKNAYCLYGILNLASSGWMFALVFESIPTFGCKEMNVAINASHFLLNQAPFCLLMLGIAQSLLGLSMIAFYLLPGPTISRFIIKDVRIITEEIDEDNTIRISIEKKRNSAFDALEASTI